MTKPNTIILNWQRYSDEMHDYFLRSDNVVDEDARFNGQYFILEYDNNFEVYLDDNINPIDHILIASGSMEHCLERAETDINKRLRGEIPRDKDGNLMKGDL